MEIRVLEYFLAVAREQNITRAAQILHITQPTLSRQLTNLEQELGKPLFDRSKRRITLTQEGMLLRKTAAEIVSLAQRAKGEIGSCRKELCGDLYIGAGESESMEHIISIAAKMQRAHPDVRFHFTSGDNGDLIDRLDAGLFDFCILFGDIDQSRYDYLPLPYPEEWGLLVRADDPLAKKEFLTTKELHDLPDILSRAAMQSPQFFRWIGKEAAQLNITNTYNLIFNAALMAKAGMGHVLTLRGLVDPAVASLHFLPVRPRLSLPLHIVFKKYRTLSAAAQAFIDAAEAHCTAQQSGALA